VGYSKVRLKKAMLIGRFTTQTSLGDVSKEEEKKLKDNLTRGKISIDVHPIFQITISSFLFKDSLEVMPN